jgi:hypothetical protein
MIQAKALTFRKSSEIVVDHFPPLLAQLHYAQAFPHVGKYVQTMCALVMNISMVPSDDTMVAFCLFDPLAKVDLPHFVNDFHPKTKFIVNQEVFIFSLACSPHLSFNSPSSMVYELL